MHHSHGLPVGVHLKHNDMEAVTLVVVVVVALVVVVVVIMVVVVVVTMVSMMMEMKMMGMMMKLGRGAVVTMVRPIHICPGYRPPAHSHQKGMNILWICHFVKKHLLIFVMDICYHDLEEGHKNYNALNKSLLKEPGPEINQLLMANVLNF